VNTAEPGTTPCGARMPMGRHPARPHRGDHQCVEAPHVATHWHRCWCGYQWGEVDPA
jgi:hypothetical protein